MLAVLKHELRLHFHSVTAYVFGAFLLAFTGIGALLYNINQAVSSFELVLNFCSMIFVVIVPILTMRVIAEERRQRTDQLLYSLPITTFEVIMGKYLALLIVYLIPLLIISLYPLIFSHYGDVYLPTAYGSIFAFFLMGAALIAVGFFISSLTESQGLAAGIGIAVILLNYYSVRLASYISDSALGSFIVLIVCALLLVLLIRHVTGNENIAYIFGIACIAVLGVLYFLKQDLFVGLLPAIMEKLSLFDRFTVFVRGVFDMNGVVFYLSVVVFFLFLSVQSLEKRRYN